MRKFMITSPSFKGQASIIYDDADRLVSFDVTNTDMAIVTVGKFKEIVPEFLPLLETRFKNTKATVVDVDFDITFDMFWNEFDVKRNKENAKTLWAKLTKGEQVQAFYSIGNYNRYCQRNTWYTKMYPDTYLRKKHFNNEWNKI